MESNVDKIIGWLGGGVVASLVAYLVGKKKAKADLGKTGAEERKIDADTYNILSEQLDAAWEKITKMREVNEEIRLGLIQCEQEKIELRRQVNALKIFEPIIKPVTKSNKKT